MGIYLAFLSFLALPFFQYIIVAGQRPSSFQHRVLTSLSFSVSGFWVLFKMNDLLTVIGFSFNSLKFLPFWLWYLIQFGFITEGQCVLIWVSLLCSDKRVYAGGFELVLFLVVVVVTFVEFCAWCFLCKVHVVSEYQMLFKTNFVLDAIKITINWVSATLYHPVDEVTVWKGKCKRQKQSSEFSNLQSEGAFVIGTLVIIYIYIMQVYVFNQCIIDIKLLFVKTFV